MVKQARKHLDEEIKFRFLNGIVEHLTDCGEEVLRVKSNEIAIPVLDSTNEERWLVITFKVPIGDRGGEAYDGYSEAESFQMKQEEKAIKIAKKEAKVTKEKAKREAKKKEAEENSASE